MLLTLKKIWYICLFFKDTQLPQLYELQKVTQRQRRIQWLTPYNCLGSSPLTLDFLSTRLSIIISLNECQELVLDLIFSIMNIAVSTYWKQSKKNKNLTKPEYHTECLTFSWQGNSRENDIHGPGMHLLQSDKAQ